MHTKPYIFQVKDARAISAFDGRCLVGNEMGTGKSLISLLWAYRHPEARPIIIICPATIKWNWQHECAQHFGWNAEVIEGTRPDMGKTFAPSSITILNYDILFAWLDHLKALEPKLVIVDECGSYLGTMYTRRTKAVRALCRGVPYVIALSGTPITSRPIEFYPTLNLLKPHLFPSFNAFGHHFCGPRRIPWGNGWSFQGASNLTELHDLLVRNVMIRRRKEDVLKELPAKQQIAVTLDFNDRKQYQHAERDFLDWLAKHRPEKLTSALKAERLVRLGYLKRLAGLLKLPSVCDWLDDFLRASDSKIIVFAVHRKVLAELEHRYQNRCVVVHGSVKGRQRQIAIQQFLHHERTRLLFGQLRAAGMGWSAKGVTTEAFAELGWTPGEHAQASDRAHGLGRGHKELPTSVYWLIGKDTVEEHVAEVLQAKQSVLDQTLDGRNGRSRLDIYDQVCNLMLKGES